jgi:hypothetical protein
VNYFEEAQERMLLRFHVLRCWIGFHTLVLMHRSQVFPEGGKRVVALVGRLHTDRSGETYERIFPAPACAAMTVFHVELLAHVGERDVLAGRVAPIFGDNDRRHFLKLKRSENWAARNVTVLIVVSRA